jgi:hypothetical protein
VEGTTCGKVEDLVVAADIFRRGRAGFEKTGRIVNQIECLLIVRGQWQGMAGIFDLCPGTFIYDLPDHLILIKIIINYYLLRYVFHGSNKIVIYRKT